MTDETEASETKHIVFEVEVPVIYTADLDDLREYRGSFETESDWLMNCIRATGICRLRTEIEGEKDSSIEEVWGHIRAVRLESPGRGYGSEPHLTDEQLAEHGWKLVPDEC